MGGYGGWALSTNPDPPNPERRYARALLDRELAVLMLGEAKLVADSEEAARERAAADEQLKKHRCVKKCGGAQEAQVWRVKHRCGGAHQL